MNTISIDFEVESAQLKNTLYRTLEVEMQAALNERGHATISITETGLKLEIKAKDLVATRAITNSILRLLQTSLDVVGSISDE